MKGLIIYDSKYGATRQYALWLSHRLLLPFRHVASVTDEELAGANFVIVGSPVYIGSLTLKKWLMKKKALLQDKKVMMFIVCGSVQDKAATDKVIMQNRLTTITARENIYFLAGRVNPQQLNIIDKLKLRLGAMLEKDPIKKKGMLGGMDGLSLQQLVPVISAANEYLASQRRGTSVVFSSVHS